LTPEARIPNGVLIRQPGGIKRRLGTNLIFFAIFVIFVVIFFLDFSDLFAILFY
jgi:hypothetical protein